MFFVDSIKMVMVTWEEIMIEKRADLPSPETQWTAMQADGSSVKRVFSNLNHSSTISMDGGMPSSNSKSYKTRQHRVRQATE